MVEEVLVVRVMKDHEVLDAYKKGEKDFSGVAIFNGDFTSKDLKEIDFTGGKLVNCKFDAADLTGADFSEAELSDSSFKKANLTKTIFSSSTIFFTGFREAFFSETNFENAKIKWCDLSETDSSKANFSGAQIEEFKGGRVMVDSEIIKKYNEGDRDFTGITAMDADFSGAILKGAIFRKANLHYSNFSSADLQGADFRDADLSDSLFNKTNLMDANLSKANLQNSAIINAMFNKANLQKANLLWCLVKDTDLTVADITDAQISWAAVVDVSISHRQLLKLDPETLKTILFQSSSKIDSSNPSYGGPTGKSEGGQTIGGTYMVVGSGQAYSQTLGSGAYSGGGGYSAKPDEEGGQFAKRVKIKGYEK